MLFFLSRRRILGNLFFNLVLFLFLRSLFFVYEVLNEFKRKLEKVMRVRFYFL